MRWIAQKMKPQKIKFEIFTIFYQGGYLLQSRARILGSCGRGSDPVFCTPSKQFSTKFWIVPNWQLWYKKTPPEWPDWAIYCSLGNFSKPVAAIIFVQIAHILCNVCKVIFQVKSFLGNFDRHLVTFYWSHWSHCTPESLEVAFCLIFSSKFYFVGFGNGCWDRSERSKLIFKMS